MVTVLRQRNYALLWIGQLISLIGDWVLNIALPFYVFGLTGSVSATVAMSMEMTVTRMLFGSLAGVFVDRWDRRKTMIAADLLRASVLLLLLAVHSREWVWLIGLTAFVQSTISQFFEPSKNATIPRLVNEQDLVAANSLNAMSDSLTRLVGPALGGALMGALGLSSVVAVDIASYLTSAALIAFIVLPADPEDRSAEPSRPATGWAALWQDWLSGLGVLRQERLLAGLFVVLGAAVFADSTLSVLIVPSSRM
jgi:MFS family permease